MSSNKYSALIIFLLFCFFYLATLTITEYVLIDENLYYNSYSHLLNDKEIQSLIIDWNDNRWIFCLTIIAFFFIKFSILTLFILSVAFFFDEDFRFQAVYLSFIEAEFWFLIPLIIKMLWFLFIDTTFTIQDIGSFYPLSLHNLFSLSQQQIQFTYVLQTLNLFEVAYLFILAARFASHLKITYQRALTYVLTGYIPVLLLWFILYTFLISLAN